MKFFIAIILICIIIITVVIFAWWLDIRKRTSIYNKFNIKLFVINNGGVISDLKAIINSEYKIIANSSFSLLGSYLGKSDKVIFPSIWWGKKRMNRIYDIKKFPDKWQVITDE